MENHDKEILIKPSLLYTKEKYSEAYNISRPTINKRIETKEIKSIKINGGVIIIAQ